MKKVRSPGRLPSGSVVLSWRTKERSSWMRLVRFLWSCRPSSCARCNTGIQTFRQFTENANRCSNDRGDEPRFASDGKRAEISTRSLLPLDCFSRASASAPRKAGGCRASGSAFCSTVFPPISRPIFDGGRIRANIEVKNAQQEQALRTYEKHSVTI